MKHKQSYLQQAANSLSNKAIAKNNGLSLQKMAKLY